MEEERDPLNHQSTRGPLFRVSLFTNILSSLETSSSDSDNDDMNGAAAAFLTMDEQLETGWSWNRRELGPGVAYSDPRSFSQPDEMSYSVQFVDDTSTYHHHWRNNNSTREFSSDRLTNTNTIVVDASEGGSSFNTPVKKGVPDTIINLIRQDMYMHFLPACIQQNDNGHTGMSQVSLSLQNSQSDISVTDETAEIIQKENNTNSERVTTTIVHNTLAQQQKQLIDSPKDTNKQDRKYNDQSNQEEQCAICLESFHEADRVFCLACSHKYHVNCLRPWMIDHIMCPIRCGPIVSEKTIRTQLSESQQSQFDVCQYIQAIQPHTGPTRSQFLRNDNANTSSSTSTSTTTTQQNHSSSFIRTHDSLNENTTTITNHNRPIRDRWLQTPERPRDPPLRIIAQPESTTHLPYQADVSNTIIFPSLIAGPRVFRTPTVIPPPSLRTTPNPEHSTRTSNRVPKTPLTLSQTIPAIDRYIMRAFAMRKNPTQPSEVSTNTPLGASTSTLTTDNQQQHTGTYHDPMQYSIKETQDPRGNILLYLGL